MEYVAHHARLDYPLKEGTLRAHLEESARRGNKVSAAELEGPPFPDSLEYLYGWALELFGRSGVGMNGLAPLSYGTIADWARLTDRHPEPHETDALMRLDAAMRYSPEEEEKAPTKADSLPVIRKSWPQKKAEGAH